MRGGVENVLGRGKCQEVNINEAWARGRAGEQDVTRQEKWAEGRSCRAFRTLVFMLNGSIEKFWRKKRHNLFFLFLKRSLLTFSWEFCKSETFGKAKWWVWKCLKQIWLKQGGPWSRWEPIRWSQWRCCKVTRIWYVLKLKPSGLDHLMWD